MPAVAVAKRVTVEGVVVLTDGRPAAHAEIIIKDSWAGLLVMRERELARVRTDSEGRFAVELRYRHTLDFYVPSRECGWWTGNQRITPGDRGDDGIYRPRFVLLADDDCKPSSAKRSTYAGTPKSSVATAPRSGRGAMLTCQL